MLYQELSDMQPPLWECFFAFSEEQFSQGLEKTGLNRSNIVTADLGLYGSKRGIQKLLSDYEERDKRIALECDPQEVYDYEFDNHECDYTGDDTEAMEIVLRIFPVEKVKKIQRRWDMTPIEKIEGWRKCVSLNA